MGKPFTEKQNEWLRSHHAKEKLIRDLTLEYNAVWNENRSVDTIKHHCKNQLGLKRKDRRFTAEMNAWLIANSGKLSAKAMTDGFNREFRQSRSAGTIKVHCNRELNIRFSNEKYRTADPIGTEKQRGKYIWIKISDKRPMPGEASAEINWEPKTHAIWKKAYGSMPPYGYSIIFLDGNPQNTEIRNLYAVSPRVKRELAKKKWYFQDRELTLAAIKWCELFYAIKNSGKDNSFECGV